MQPFGGGEGGVCWVGSVLSAGGLVSFVVLLPPTYDYCTGINPVFKPHYSSTRSFEA